MGKKQGLGWEGVWKAGAGIRTSGIFLRRLELSGGFDSLSGEAEEDQTGALQSGNLPQARRDGHCSALGSCPLSPPAPSKRGFLPG